MLKRMVTWILLLAACCGIFSSASANEAADALNVQVLVNGELLQFEQEPVILNGTTMVPLRKIFEALGAEVSWHQNIQTVKGTNGNKKVQLRIGSTTAIVNGSYLMLEQAPLIRNGSTLVPVRLVSEAMGSEVSWDGTTRTVSILKPAAGPQTEATTSSTKPILENNPYKAKGKLVIGTSADYPPYEFHKLIDGKDTIAGLDIAIAKRIANDLGVPLEIKDMGFDKLFPALEAGKVDMVIAAVSPTSERRKNFEFSKIYYFPQQSVVVRSHDQGKYLIADDLNGANINVLSYSILESMAKEQFPNAEIQTSNSMPEVFQALISKEADACIVPFDMASNYINKGVELFVSPIPLEVNEQGTAVMFRKGTDSEIVAAVNQTITNLIISDEVGEWFAEAYELAE